jgi:DNA-directed RNA polymerase beta' subunit
LIEGKQSNCTLLVCTAFNADFDGSNGGTLPLGPEAIFEAILLMLVS